ncbi:MAG: GNAT family N-acetyltransferase [Saprospiraceae bacterium]
MIRKYREADLDVLLTIWESASTLAHPFLDSLFTEKVKVDMRKLYLPNSDTWIFEKNKTPIGFISMLGNEIGGLFVNPKNQSKGIGTSLVNYVAQMHPVLEVEVFTKNKIGEPFYDKYGFVLTKEYFNEAAQEMVLRMKYNKLITKS